jgi:GGDEF domain-containing protein
VTPYLRLAADIDDGMGNRSDGSATCPRGSRARRWIVWRSRRPVCQARSGGARPIRSARHEHSLSLMAGSSTDASAVLRQAEGVVSRLGQIAPSFSAAVLLRCAATGRWQLAAVRGGSAADALQAFKAVQRHLSTNVSLGEHGGRTWYAPVVNDAGRLAGCFLLVAPNERSLPGDTGARLAAAFAESSARLNEVRLALDRAYAERLAAALVRLPELLRRAGSWDDAEQALLDTIVVIAPDAEALMFRRDPVSGRLAPHGGAAARENALHRVARDALQLGRVAIHGAADAYVLAPNARQIIAAPILVGSHARGAVACDVPIAGRVWDEADARWLLVAAEMAGVGGELGRLRRHTLIRDERDPETGLRTGAAFRISLDTAVDDAKQRGTSFAVILLRLLTSAEAAPGALARFGRRLGTAVISGDAVAFMLGDGRFAIIGSLSARDARLLTSRLRLLAEHGLGLPDRVTLLAGVALYPTHAATARDLALGAGEALDRAGTAQTGSDVMAEPRHAGAQNDHRRERLEALRTLAGALLQERPQAAAVVMHARSIARRLDLDSMEVAQTVLTAELSALITETAGGGADTAETRNVQRAALVALVAGVGFPELATTLAMLDARWDGSGDPPAAGATIPRPIRIVAAAGVAARAHTAEAAIALRRARGSLLDPEIADTASQTLAD